MAKQRGPLGQLFLILFLLVVLAAGAGVALALVYDDDDMRAQLKSAGLPDDQVARVMAVKQKIRNVADYSGDDMLFALRTTWWDLRDAFDLDLTSTATFTLEPVRHIVQAGGAPHPDDPKEPAATAQGAAGAPMSAEPAPEQPAATMAEKPDAEAAMPASAKPEPMKEEPAAPAPEQPKAPAKDAKPAKDPMPAPPKAKKVEKPAPPPAPATEKPVDLMAKEPEKAPEPAAQAAALPEAPKPAPKAAPAPAPAPAAPASAEERLAAADLTYKRALGLFADAKSDTEKADVAKLFAQAAIDGHPGAQYSIGVMHYNGTGVAKDYTKAAEWFGRAAEKGNPAAQYNLGILYYNGQGVEKNDRQAYKWISAAAENGDQKAIVARDALKKALPADITKPETPAFPGSALPSAAPTQQ